jgi:hypothetical protein
MGILAVIDTFLVYKIAETRYNRKVGFISATLFAVMPLSRILRGILLDSIELPFILLSILFAVYYAKTESQTTKDNKIDKNILLVLLSGIFLGLALFTKVPVFTMIPLLAFIILKRHVPGMRGNITRWSRLKTLGIWFIPVVLIPMMWPAYAVSNGQFGDWLDGVLYQAGRQGGRDLSHSVMLVTQIDPLLVTLGLAAVIFCIIKKDYFVLLWTLPYLIFLALIGWVVYFHWSILLPILCIALGMMVESLRERFAAHKFIGLLPYVMVSAVVIFGLVSFTILASSDLNKTYNEVYLLVTRELHQNDEKTDNKDDQNGTTLIGSHRTRALVWIPKYVFNDDVTFRDTDLPNDNFTKPVLTKKFLIVADSNLLNEFAQIKQDVKYNRITLLYYNTSNTIATFIDQQIKKNNLLGLRENSGFGQFIEVKANY